MKTLRNVFVAVVAGTLAIGLCSGADTGVVLAPAFPGRVLSTIDPATGLPAKEPEPEKRFDLDFKGGTPQQLVEAVEKAAQMPINNIIPEEHRDFFLPPLKLRNVTVPQLFQAIVTASTKSETRQLRGHMPGAYGNITSGYGFRTTDNRPNANSIWHFYVDTPPPPERPQQPEIHCRFWQLEPYLEKLKVEDVTTAIETGWKMLGVNPLPKLSFHKDTKLLIVVGQRSHLTIVDEVLRELTSARKSPKDSSGQNAPTAGEKPSKQ